MITTRKNNDVIGITNINAINSLIAIYSSEVFYQNIYLFSDECVSHSDIQDLPILYNYIHLNKAHAISCYLQNINLGKPYINYHSYLNQMYNFQYFVNGFLYKKDKQQCYEYWEKMIKNKNVDTKDYIYIDYNLTKSDIELWFLKGDTSSKIRQEYENDLINYNENIIQNLTTLDYHKAAIEICNTLNKYINTPNEMTHDLYLTYK